MVLSPLLPQIYRWPASHLMIIIAPRCNLWYHFVKVRTHGWSRTSRMSLLFTAKPEWPGRGWWSLAFFCTWRWEAMVDESIRRPPWPASVLEVLGVALHLFFFFLMQFFPTAEESMDYYNQKRCLDAKGLVLPSQIVSPPPALILFLSRRSHHL